MRLEMRSQNAYIGIKSTPPVQSIRQPKAEQSIETEQVKVTVESTLPKVKIDQKRAFSESGLKGVLETVKDNAQRGVNIMIQKIDRIVQEGNQFADIQNGVDVVAENADENAFSQFNGDLNIVTMPSSGPDIEVEEGKNEIKVTGGQVDIKTTPHKPEHDYKQGKVDIYMRQRNSLEIKAVGDKFDKKI